MWQKLHSTRPLLGQLVLIYSPAWPACKPKAYVWDERYEDTDWSNEQHVWWLIPALPQLVQEPFPKTD